MNTCVCVSFCLPILQVCTDTVGFLSFNWSDCYIWMHLLFCSGRRMWSLKYFPYLSIVSIVLFALFVLSILGRSFTISFQHALDCCWTPTGLTKEAMDNWLDHATCYLRKYIVGRSIFCNKFWLLQTFQFQKVQI